MFIMINFLFFIKYMNALILFIIIFYLIIKSDTIVMINIVFEYVYLDRVSQRHLYNLDVLLLIKFNNSIFI